MFRSALCILLFLTLTLVACGTVYEAMDENYQEAMDPVRIEDTNLLLKFMLAYRVKAQKFPFQEIATDKPVMVVIGHSPAEEEYYSSIDVLDKGAWLLTSKELEDELSSVFGAEIDLQSDPQKVATFAPNVYVYFLTPDEDMCIIAHLHQPTSETVEYEWEGGKFHSYANCISKQSNL